MKTKSVARASLVLLAEMILILTMTSCPNLALSLSKLRATGSISGIVVSETGDAIGGAVVTAEKTDGIKSSSTSKKLGEETFAKSIAAQATTDREGAFILSGLAAGIYTLNVTVPETQAKAISGVTVFEGQIVTTGTLQVRKTGDIAGLVALSDAADALGVIVFIAGTSYSAMADSAGNFRISEVPIGTGYTLVVSKMGYDSAITSVDVVVRATTTVSPITLQPTVPPSTTGSAKGIVTLSGQTDHAGIFVYLVGTSHICVTNSTGEFEIGGAAPGTYTLKASKDGYDPASVSLTIEAGYAAESGIITLEPTQTAARAGPYFVTYDANGATAGSPPIDISNYFEGYRVTALQNSGDLEKHNCAPLSGWNTSADGSGTQYAPGATFIMGSSDVTLYAIYPTLPTYSVTYDANGATGGEVPVDPASPYVFGDLARVIYDVNLVRTGYTFIGWTVYLQNGTIGFLNGWPVMIIPDYDIVLYATWEPN